MTTTFADLGVSDDLCAALESRGIIEPFAIQTSAIPDALAGEDVCGKARTGSGKTLAFGVPVIQKIGKAKSKRPLAIALVPTRELAVQVADELAPLARSRGLVVAPVYGGANIERQITKLENGIDFVVATPGRMIDLVERKAVSLADLTHVIVDEADRMADMGFLPQVEWLLRQVEGEHQTLLFSATLDGVVDSLVRRYQTDPKFHEVESPQVTVDQMTHRFIQVHQMDKVKVAATISKGVSRTLMFTATKHMADRLARELVDLGIDAAAIHGDLRQNHREQALNRFSEGKLAVLVATDVAARGIHVDDVEIVIHYDPPGEHKTYLHRSGRTARAGGEGLVVTLVLFNEELEVRRMQRRVGLDMPIVEMFSNDERLSDLVSWNPAA